MLPILPPDNHLDVLHGFESLNTKKKQWPDDAELLAPAKRGTQPDPAFMLLRSVASSIAASIGKLRQAFGRASTFPPDQAPR
jgi:hypothetical protein